MRTKLVTGTMVLAWCCVFTGNSFGQKEAPSVSPEALKRGQTITCSSVLGDPVPWDKKRDEKPTSFKLAFKGLIDFPDFHTEKLILAEMKDKSLPVAHGMSGSPCSVHGKIIGALSMDLLAFPKNHKGFAGITPIRAMLDPDSIIRGTASHGNRTGVFVTELFGLNDKQIEGLNRTLGYTAFRVSGIALAPMSSSYEDRPARRLRPGESVMGMLADGDFPVGFGCAITYVTDKEFGACGHPVVGQALVYPAYRSKIITILRSDLTSSKAMGDILERAGTFTDDTPFAVKGVNEVRKDIMLPVHFEIKKNGALYDYRFRVLRHPYLSSQLVGDGMLTLVSNVWNPNDVATAKLAAKIYLKGRNEPLAYYCTDVIEIRRMKLEFLEGFSNPWAILENVQDALAAIQQSDWHLAVDRVEVNLDIQSGRQILKLDSLAVLNGDGKPTEEIHAGEAITIEIGMRNGTSTEKLVHRFTIHVPKDVHFVTAQTVNQQFLTAKLFIMSGGQYQELDPEKLPKGEPDSAEAFLKLFSLGQKDPSRIYAALMLPEEKFAESLVDSVSVPNLPENKWQEVPNLAFLHEQSRASRHRVFVFDLGAPRENAVTTVADREHETPYSLKELKFILNQGSK